jgi:hypothetical protein
MPMKKRRTLHRLRTITLLVQMPRKMAWRMPKVKYGWLTKPTRLVYVRRSVPLRERRRRSTMHLPVLPSTSVPAACASRFLLRS